MSQEDWLLNFVVRAHDQATAVLKNFGHEAQIAGEVARMAFVGIGAAATLAVGESLHLAETFDRDMRKVAALADGTTEHLDEMKKAVLELSTVVPKSADDLAQALYLVRSSGFAGSDSMQILEAAAKAATSGLTDTRVVVDAVTSALVAYKMHGSDAGDITGKLIAAVTAGKTEVSELAGAFGRVLPLAAAAGVNFDQVAASLSTMTRTGLKADEAATALRSAIVALEVPHSKARDVIANLGMTVDQVRSSMLTNYMGTLEMMMEKTHGNIEMLSALFPNIRAFTGVLSTAGSQGKAYAEILDTITKAGAAANENAFNITMQGAGPQLELTKNALAAVAIELGEELLPHLVEFAKWAREAVKGIEAWVKQNPEFAKFAAIALGVAAGLSAISVVVGPLVAIVGGLVAVLGGPLVLAILAVVAAGVLIVTHWEDVKQSAALLWGIVSKLFQQGVAAVTETIGGFFSFWGKVWSTFSEKPLYWIVYFVTTAVRNFLEFTNNALKVLGEFFTALPGNVAAWLGEVFNAIGTFVHDALQAFVGWRDNVNTTITDFFTDLPGRMFDFGKQLVQGLINGIGSMFSALGSAVHSIVDQVTDGFKAALGASPIIQPGAIPSFAGGGIMSFDGLAYVHAGEEIRTPAQQRRSEPAATHPVYVYVNSTQASGADVRQMDTLEEFLSAIHHSARS